ncbi:response regulator [Azospirillum brasilense]|uniref:response regulator n=1 Tax=Azospirillum brasilense TaxID=192 RepID=UPI001FFE5894|nr:response regulator [Azospirillum brasilense]
MNDPGGKGAPKLGLLSVLVVEDSAFIRNVLTATLRTIGVGAVHAEAGGAEAIRFLEERRAAPPPRPAQRLPAPRRSAGPPRSSSGSRCWRRCWWSPWPAPGWPPTPTTR